MKFIKIIIAIFFFLLLSGCGLKVVQSEKKYLYIAKSEINSQTLGNGKVLFYNYGYYCPLVECGRTTKLNIKLNGISLGQINYGQYFIVELENGTYDVDLVHRDVILMSTKTTLTVNDKTMVVQAIPTPFSNKVTVEQSIPDVIYQLNAIYN